MNLSAALCDWITVWSLFRSFWQRCITFLESRPVYVTQELPERLSCLWKTFKLRSYNVKPKHSQQLHNFLLKDISGRRHRKEVFLQSSTATCFLGALGDGEHLSMRRSSSTPHIHSEHIQLFSLA